MLSKVAEYHNEWISYVGKICGESYYVEDIVQEMYLKIDNKKLHTKIVVNGKVNKWYILTTLKNMVADFYRAKKKVVKVDYLQAFEEDFKFRQGLDPEELQQRHARHLTVCEALRNEHTYYETLYLIYTSGSNPSYQDIANETGISKATIANDFKKIKNILQNGSTT